MDTAGEIKRNRSNRDFLIEIVLFVMEKILRGILFRDEKGSGEKFCLERILIRCNIISLFKNKFNLNRIRKLKEV